MRPTKIRRRFNNLNEEISMEDTFLGLKSKLEFLDSFTEAFGQDIDPII